MRAAVALALITGLSPAAIASSCPAPGEPVQWRADYCMLKLETDDEIAASACIVEEGKRRFRSTCASNTHFKRRMCELMIRSGTRGSSLAQCVQDPDFMGGTVRRGGVGGR